MNRISIAIVFFGIVFFCPAQMGRCENAPAALQATSPEGVAVQFFTW